MLYLASPFFNKIENTALDAVEAALEKNQVTFFSPRNSPGNILGITQQEKLKNAPVIFSKDIEMMERAEILFANTDGYPFEYEGRTGVARDAGTAFELGYFYCKHSKKARVPNIVTFSTQGYDSNLMIAQASRLHLTSVNVIGDFFSLAGEVWNEGAFKNHGQNYYFWSNVIDAYIVKFSGKGMVANVANP